MKKLIFATGNEGKMREIRMILSDLPVEVISMQEAGIRMDIVEDGNTFEENAIIKARAVMERTHQMVLADDSGLEVDFLNKEPGIYSARYLGEDTPYAIKNQNILDRLKEAGPNQRTARFVCAAAVVYPDGRTQTCRGVMEGVIGDKIAGENGFGYDPIFYLPEYGCTTAQLDPETKNAISHRGKALRAIRKVIEHEL